jgi:hypothetical protein
MVVSRLTGFYVARRLTAGPPDVTGGLLAFDSPTTATGAGETDDPQVIPLGFDFTIPLNVGGDRVADQVAVHPRGVVDFSGLLAAPELLDPANLFDNNNAYPLVAAWWGELETLADGVRYETQGTAPRRRCIIEWHCKANEAQSGTDYWSLRFQVVLNEVDDSIEFRYGPVVEVGTPDYADLTGSAIGFNAGGGFAIPGSATFRNFQPASTPHVYGGSQTNTALSFPVEATPGAGHGWPGDYDTLTARPVGGWLWVPAVPCPKAVDLLTAFDLAAPIPAGAPVLRKLLRNVNALYCAHRPALVSLCPDGEAQTGTNTYVVPVRPSRGSLQYDVLVEVLVEDTSQSVTVAVYEGDISESYGSALATDVVAPTDGSRPEPLTLQCVLDPTTYYLKVTVANTTAGVSRASAILVYPSAITWLGPGGDRGEELYLFNENQLRASGAAIHTELLNRAWASVYAIRRDREQSVGGYLQTDDLRSGALSGDSDPFAQLVWGQPSLRGQTGGTLTCRVSAIADSGTPTLAVGEEGGDAAPPGVVPLTLTETTHDVTISRETPALFVRVQATGSDRVRVRFAHFTWIPGD